MEEKPAFQSWKDFTQQEYRRCATFQLSIEELARDLYYDERMQEREEAEEELNFDR